MAVIYKHAPPEQSTRALTKTKHNDQAQNTKHQAQGPYSSSGSANVRSIIVSCVCTGAKVCDVPK